MDQDAIIERLDALIAATKAAGVGDRWLTADEVGAILGYDPRTVRERLALRPDFPKALRIEGSAFPRWKKSEIEAWADGLRDEPVRQRRAGRPRKAA